MYPDQESDGDQVDQSLLFFDIYQENCILFHRNKKDTNGIWIFQFYKVHGGTKYYENFW